MGALHRYVLLYIYVTACLLDETSCTNEVSKVYKPHRSSQSRKRRFLIYPDNGSYAEVMAFGSYYKLFTLEKVKSF
jgi:hypothetical protein